MRALGSLLMTNRKICLQKAGFHFFKFFKFLEFEIAIFFWRIDPSIFCEFIPIMSANSKQSHCFCCVPKCKKSKITFDFPADSEQRAKWMKALRLRENPIPESRVCSHHFSMDDMFVNIHRLIQQKEGAVPLDESEVGSSFSFISVKFLIRFSKVRCCFSRNLMF